MTNVRTKVFRNNRSQAVRLPKAVELPESVQEVEIIAIGNRRIITPAGDSWDSWFEGPPVSPDFMENRDQPEEQRREGL